MGNRNDKRRGGPNKKGGKPQQKIYTGKNVDYMGDQTRMKRHAVDVFRDMSRGRYNAQNIMEFQNKEFIMACIHAAEENMRQHDIIRTALLYAYGQSNDPDVSYLLNKAHCTYNGWAHVRNMMSMFMYSNDFGIIYGLINQLSTNRELRL